jgi:hypothetical protein
MDRIAKRKPTPRANTCRMEPLNFPVPQNRDLGRPRRKLDGIFKTSEISKLVTS